MSATLERGPAVTAAYAGRRRLPVAVPVAIVLAWAAAVAAHATGVAGRFHHDALLGGGTPSLAGVFQFSSLKDRCLTECRHPAAYLLRHYRRGPRAAFRLGWGHGLYCLGCCWALMLVMFSVGVADLGWMAAMAGLMAYEKLGRHGRGAAIATGVAALALAALVALHPAWMPPVMASHG
jgi:predicted metal-binding membrane protein